MLIDQPTPKKWDTRRKLVVPGDYNATLEYCVKHFIEAANRAVRSHGEFFVALSGGSTPKAIFEKLCRPPYSKQLNWSKVHLFWSDERSVPSDHPDSNYRMAMDAGLKEMPIPKNHIHRMLAEADIEKNAEHYEQTIRQTLKARPFDLIMLGMGGDGHTASLFPHTKALHVHGRLVAANFISDKNTWRMTLTYDCINQAEQTVIYVLGASKKEMLSKVLSSRDRFEDLPVQKIGTDAHPALWIADAAAAVQVLK